MKRLPIFLAAALAVAGLSATAHALAPSAEPAPRMNWKAGSLRAPAFEAGDSFGYGVAIDNDVAMVGAGSSTGRVFVYRQIDGEWIQQQELEPQQPRPAMRGFGTTIDLRGSMAIIGESGWSNPGQPRPAETPPQLPQALDPFAAYVFEQQDGVWRQVARLEAEDGGFGGNHEWGGTSSFATAVAIDGRTAAVGAFLQVPDASPQTGAVYLFSDDGTGWRQTQKLVPADGRAGDQFGFSVAMRGDTLLVGARNATTNRAIPEQGSVYVFERRKGVWTQTQKLHDAASPALMQFGASLALEGDTAVVGASHAGGQLDFDLWPTFGHGAVYFLSRANGRWSIRDKLTLSEPFNFPNFLGQRVALSGDLAVSSATTSFVLDGVIQPGAVYTFERVGERWFHQSRILAPDMLPYSKLGEHVAISGRKIFSARVSTDELFYFDGGRPAIAAIAPTQLNIVLQPGASSQIGLRINNPGELPLDFDLAGSSASREVVLHPRGESRPQPWPETSAADSDMVMSAKAGGVSVSAPTPTGAALQFALDDGSYEEMMTMWHPYEEHAGIYLNRFAAPSGTGAFTIDSLSIAFPADLPRWTLAGKQVNLVAYYDADADGNPRNAVRLGGDHFVVVTAANEFLRFPVDFRVPGDGDIYVGFESAYARSGNWPILYPAALDTTAPVFRHSWLAGTLDDRPPNLDNLDDNAIQGMVENFSFSGGGNWLIRANGVDAANDCVAPAAVPWLSIGTPSGSVAAGSQVTSLLSFQTTGLSGGTHRATLCVATSDSNHAMVRIPLALTVLPDGVIFRDGFEGTP